MPTPWDRSQSWAKARRDRMLFCCGSFPQSSNLEGLNFHGVYLHLVWNMILMVHLQIKYCSTHFESRIVSHSPNTWLFRNRRIRLENFGEEWSRQITNRCLLKLPSFFLSSGSKTKDHPLFWCWRSSILSRKNSYDINAVWGCQPCCSRFWGLPVPQRNAKLHSYSLKSPTNKKRGFFCKVVPSTTSTRYTTSH